jgi:catechol 2,3-dioxygenase-like lactoylglutathione lyase family enzyme
MVIDLDHVAIALYDVTRTLHVLAGELGAPVLFGGANLGFRAMQVDGGDLRIELLEPWNIEVNDFLARFLERHGEGPHHLTFKTDDIRSELERAEAAGYHPVGVSIDNPWWMEAFLHPSEAGGTVVQIAQSGVQIAQSGVQIAQAGIESEEFDLQVHEYGPGRWWAEPPDPSPNRAILRRVVVTTDEIGRALALYRELLGGDPIAHGEGWTELGWPGGGRIRLEVAAQRPWGINRLEWTHDGRGTDRYVGGTRFVLYSAES